MMAEYTLIAILLALAWLWMDSVGKREIAIRFGREVSQRFQLQLLDETVACTQIRFARDSRGHLRFKRLYTFDVASSSDHRMACQVTLLGDQLLNWHIPPYPQPHLHIVH